MTLALDIYWSFRSPYCYLALDRILSLTRTYDVEVGVRPVYPLAIRTPEFFTRSNPLYRSYNLLDTQRLAEYLQVPYRRPVPDPIVQDLATSRIAAEQPYIFRLTRLGMAAVLEGRGLAFLDQVSRIIWDGSVDGWHEGPHLGEAVRRAGLDLAPLDQAIADDPARYDAHIHANQEAHVAAGHWGVPTLVFEGEPFFGQDRLDVLVWRMRQAGLRQRHPDAAS